MADMVGGGALVHSIMVMLMILALILSIMTAMAGSSRTLYQGSVDGWLPKYLTHVNAHGAPTRAMWTDLNLTFLIIFMMLNINDNSRPRILREIQKVYAESVKPR